MINFYLPNFANRDFYALNTYFIHSLKNHPEWFYDNVQIGALYGTFPGVIWNGGRVVKGDLGISLISKIIQHFDKLNTPLRFTYTNSLIQEEHLLDIKSNLITDIANTGKNEILVNSPILEMYLRQKYPNFKYISSTTKCLLESEDIFKEQEKYYLTVLDYRKNNDINFLSTITNPEKFEILINAYCDPNCQNRKQHYEELSRLQLSQENDIETPKCNLLKQGFFDTLSFPTVITVEDLYNIYAPSGFCHFKIEGRTNHIIDVLESYLYYMVKPEHKDGVRYGALKSFMNSDKFLDESF